jgi:hypothetical protein
MYRIELRIDNESGMSVESIALECGVLEPRAKLETLIIVLSEAIHIRISSLSGHLR